MSGSNTEKNNKTWRDDILEVLSKSRMVSGGSDVSCQNSMQIHQPICNCANIRYILSEEIVGKRKKKNNKIPSKSVTQTPGCRLAPGSRLFGSETQNLFQIVFWAALNAAVGHSLFKHHDDDSISATFLQRRGLFINLFTCLNGETLLLLL